jgi:hypothetical protein
MGWAGAEGTKRRRAQTYLTVDAGPQDFVRTKDGWGKGADVERSAVWAAPSVRLDGPKQISCLPLLAFDCRQADRSRPRRFRSE